MKMKIFWLLIGLFFLSASVVEAQKKANINITPGVTLVYKSSDQQGNEITFPLTVNTLNDECLEFAYKMTFGPRSFTGRFIIAKEGLEKGKHLNWNELNPEEVRELPKDQTIFCFSQAFLKEIKANKSANYDNKTFYLTEKKKGDEVIIDKKVINSIYVTTKDKKLSYWILDNPDVPLIINSKGNMGGPDFLLAEVTNSGS